MNNDIKELGGMIKNLAAAVLVIIATVVGLPAKILWMWSEALMGMAKKLVDETTTK